MSHLFNNAAWFMKRTAAIVAAEPFTVSLWVQMLNHADAADNVLFSVMKTTGAGNLDGWLCGIDTSARPYATATHANAFNGSTAAAIADEQWHHCLYEFASTASRTAYRDNVAGTPNTTSTVPTGMDGTNIGGWIDTSGVLTGAIGRRIVWLGVWNATLSASDKLMLFLGEKPEKVARPNLIAAPDLLKNAWDPIAQINYTVSGTVPDSSNPAQLRRHQGGFNSGLRF